MTTQNRQGGSDPEIATTHANGSTIARIVGAWLIVGVPLAWGVSQTFILSLKLFDKEPTTAPVVAPVFPGPTTAATTGPAGQ